jgi:hypothetical protein
LIDKSQAKAKKPKLTPTQAKVVKAKIKAELTDTPIYKIAQEVFPNQKPTSANTSMHDVLQKPSVQEALAIAMAKYGLTEDTLAASVGSAMGAYKTVAVEGDLIETEVPDHSIRLKAAGMAAQWMGVGKGENTSTSLHFHQHVENKKDEYAD